MIEFYPQIKMVHVVAAACSGILFLLRGLMVQTGHGAWARRPALRYVSYAIDSILLTAALMLFTMLPPAAFGNGWLWIKLALLAIYIALGMNALRERITPRRRRICFAAALCAFGLIVSIARAHHPLGVFRAFFPGP